jgi:hypothetical protein
MYFTRYDDIPIIYYIDKKVQPGYQVPRMILTKGMWDESLFSNTLLDGEMVKDAFGGWLFLINDVIAYKDRFLSDEPLPKRLELAFEILDTCHTCDEIIDVCTFQVKQYANATQEGTDALIELAKTLPYTSRGLYYWPFSNKYKPKLINFNDDLIKSVYRKVKDTPDFRETGPAPPAPTAPPASTTPKEPIEVRAFEDIAPTESLPTETVAASEKVFWLRKTEHPDVYDIYDSDYAQHKDTKVGIAQVPGMATSKMLRAAFKDVTVAIYIPFVCTYNSTAEKWLPLRKYQK